MGYDRALGSAQPRLASAEPRRRGARRRRRDRRVPRVPLAHLAGRCSSALRRHRPCSQLTSSAHPDADRPTASSFALSSAVATDRRRSRAGRGGERLGHAPARHASGGSSPGPSPGSGRAGRPGQRSMSGSRRLAVLALVASTCVASPLLAQSAKSGSAEAEELFKQGRAALEARDYATACARFSSSLAIERAVGTLISLAQCEEASGRLASARQHWQEAADLADATNDRLNRGPVARKKVAELDPKVPRLVVRLAAGAPEGTTVQRDDVDLGSKVFGVALPVDPGPHVLTVVAPGRASRKYSITAAVGENVVEVEPGTPDAAPVSPAPVAPAQPLAPAATASSPPSASHGGVRPLAWVALGLGVVGVGVGSYFGVDAMSKWSDAKNSCGTGCPDGSRARNERSDALSGATVSTVSFVVGGVGLAAAAWLLLAPQAPETARLRIEPSIGYGSAGLQARGAF